MASKIFQGRALTGLYVNLENPGEDKELIVPCGDFIRYLGTKVPTQNMAGSFLSTAWHVYGLFLKDMLSIDPEWSDVSVGVIPERKLITLMHTSGYYTFRYTPWMAQLQDMLVPQDVLEKRSKDMEELEARATELQYGSYRYCDVIYKLALLFLESWEENWREDGPNLCEFCEERQVSSKV